MASVACMTSTSDSALNVLSGYIGTPQYNELPHVVKMAVQCCQRIVQEFHDRQVTRADFPRVEIVSLFRQTNEFAMLPTELQAAIRNWLVQLFEWGKQVDPVFVESPLPVTAPAGRISATFAGQSVTKQEIPGGIGDLSDKPVSPPHYQTPLVAKQDRPALLQRYIESEAFNYLSEAEKDKVRTLCTTGQNLGDAAMCAVDFKPTPVYTPGVPLVLWDPRPRICLDWARCDGGTWDMYVTVTHGIRFAPEVPVEQKVAEAKASMVYEETGEQSSEWSGVAPLVSEPLRGRAENVCMVDDFDVFGDPIMQQPALTEEQPTTEQRLISVLNSLFQADPGIIRALLDVRIPCGPALADQEFCLVCSSPPSDDKPGGYVVSGLGLLNGLLKALSIPGVAATYDTEDATKAITGFTTYKGEQTETSKPAAEYSADPIEAATERAQDDRYLRQEVLRARQDKDLEALDKDVANRFSFLDRSKVTEEASI